MSLKDWRKQSSTTPSENLYVYVRKDNGDKWLGMRKVENLWHTILPGGKRRKFETRSGAETYIKKYMRSH